MPLVSCLWGTPLATHVTARTNSTSHRTLSFLPTLPRNPIGVASLLILADLTRHVLQDKGVWPGRSCSGVSTALSLSRKGSLLTFRTLLSLPRTVPLFRLSFYLALLLSFSLSLFLSHHSAIPLILTLKECDRAADTIWSPQCTWSSSQCKSVRGAVCPPPNASLSFFPPPWSRR